MRVLIIAGGTAGHINPALAVASEIESQIPNAKILFAGREKGMEYELVTGAGYEFVNIEVHGIQRSLSLTNIKRNIVALWHLMWAIPTAKKIVKNFNPDICIGFGGYVSGPVVRAAAKAGVKTVIHEQNAFPGVTNKLLAKKVDLILCATQAAAQRFSLPNKTVVVGNPVRREIFTEDAQKAREAIGAKGKTVIVSFGGSLGARPLNMAVLALAKWHLQNRNYLHIHATGKAGWQEFKEIMQAENVQESENFIVKEYIENMPELLAAANLVICRAGAVTLSELKAAGRASILVPSPYVAENHQYFNAEELEDAGAAVLIEEKDLSTEKLIETVDALCKNPEKLETMGKKAKKLATQNTSQIVVEELQKLIN